MPLRTFLASSCPSLLCSEEELQGWKQLLSLEQEPADAGAAVILDFARIRTSLVHRSVWDDHTVDMINALCPHWPPLWTSIQWRDYVFRVALGLDPSLPWDSLMEDPSTIPALLREKTEHQLAALLLWVNPGA